MKRFAVVLISFMCLSYVAVAATTAGEEEDMNQYVVEVVKSFPTDGTHTYWWPKENIYDGATTDVYCMGKKVMRGEPQGRTFCCGLTLEVFYRAMEKYDKKHGLEGVKNLPLDRVKNFQRLWFCPKSKAWGPGEALTAYGMGKMIKNFEDARFGDFLQFWRTSGSGHSVLFVKWIRDENNNIKGFQYWSAQKKTNGIGYSEEHFEGENAVDKENFYLSRLTDPKTWKPLEEIEQSRKAEEAKKSEQAEPTKKDKPEKKTEKPK
jgi:hypothetical protein